MWVRKSNGEAFMLKVSNVYKQFGDISVLSNVSLEIKHGSIVGLAGPSGSGKSTLLRCLQKLEKIDKGQIECKGKTGFMFQDFQLFPHMTVMQNIVYAPNLKAKANHTHERAMSLLKNLSIESKANHFPHQLSGGQKQRVALARSLMMEPEYLFCDEPTSGLDVATTQDVVTLLDAVKSMGVTMIIASHDLDFLTKIADRIVVLKQGIIALDVDPKVYVEPIQHLKEYY
jgi:polar amino acid transport system ATP-binding protein